MPISEFVKKLIKPEEKDKDAWHARVEKTLENAKQGKTLLEIKTVQSIEDNATDILPDTWTLCLQEINEKASHLFDEDTRLDRVECEIRKMDFFEKFIAKIGLDNFSKPKEPLAEIRTKLDEIKKGQITLGEKECKDVTEKLNEIIDILFGCGVAQEWNVKSFKELLCTIANFDIQNQTSKFYIAALRNANVHLSQATFQQINKAFGSGLDFKSKLGDQINKFYDSLKKDLMSEKSPKETLDELICTVLSKFVETTTDDVLTWFAVFSPYWDEMQNNGAADEIQRICNDINALQTV